MYKRFILVSFPLYLSSLFFASLTVAEDAEFKIVNKWPVKASKAMPEAGGPEARAVEFIQLISARNYDGAKAYFSPSISKEARKSWDKFNSTFDTTYDAFTSLYSWHVYKVEKGMPIAKLVFITKKGGKPRLTIPMKKEDGKWMIAGY